MLESQTGPLAAEAQLHFSGTHGHAHQDPLNLTFWAYGHELVSDVGYTHTRYRRYATSAAAHNLVVVNEMPASTGLAAIPWTGTLRVWHTGKLCQAAIVDMGGPSSYAVCSLYQRSVALVDRPDAAAYLVDFFDVHGGSQHDWLMRGSADHDQAAHASAPLQSLDHSLLGPGRKLVPYINEGGYDLVAVNAENANEQPADGTEVQFNPYGLILDLRRASGLDHFIATFEYTEEDKPRMNLHVLSAGDSEYYLATAPSIKRSNQNSDTLEQFRQPLVVVRRQSPTELQSRFTALLWPYERDAGRVSFTALTSDGQLVGAQVAFGDYTDLIVAPPEKPQGPIQLDQHQVVTDAAFAMLRLQYGKPVAAELADGTVLQMGGVVLKAPESLTGRILQATGGMAEGSTVMRVSTAQPTAAWPAGARVHVTHDDGAFSLMHLERFETRDDGTFMHVLEAPDFSVEGEQTQFHYYPIRTVPGQPAFTVPAVATWSLAD